MAGAQALRAEPAVESPLPDLRAAVATLIAKRPVHVLINNTAGPAGGPVQTAGEDAEDPHGHERDHLRPIAKPPGS